MKAPKLRVLVTGGSGYLGQFLVHALTAAGHHVVWTYHSTTPALSAPGQAFRVNLSSGDGLAACLAACSPLDCVINTAALSQPGACAKDEAGARALNVPSLLLEHLKGAAPGALFIHISTDQVYSGLSAFSKEEDAGGCTQANAYGMSKALAEAAVRSAWPHHLLLRTSIIFGPQPPYAPVSRALFLQWLDGALSSGPVDLFEDEWRSPILVHDLVDLCLQLLTQDSPITERTLNAGGPERLSRADMGDAVCAVRGYPRENVRRVPCSSVQRSPASPADISMDVTRLERVFRGKLSSFGEALLTRVWMLET